MRIDDQKSLEICELNDVILLMATRNPARKPVDVGSLSHYLQGFSTIPGGCLGLLNHQQYHVGVEEGGEIF